MTPPLPRSATLLMGFSFRLPFLGALAVLLLAALPAGLLRAQPQGQRSPPHLGYAYPAGGQVGTTFTITVGGQNLNGNVTAFFSSPGVTATFKEYTRPMTQKEFNDLREEIGRLQEKRAAALGLPPPSEREPGANKGGPVNAAAVPAPASSGPKPTWTPEDQRLLATLRAKAARRPNRQGNPAIAENVALEVTVGADAAPGACELRLRSAAGLSNPLRFELGTLAESGAPAVTASDPTAMPAGRDSEPRSPRRQEPARRVVPPLVLNGQILPGEVDGFEFAGRKGERLTAAVSARALVPYLADAVPGWFQATLSLQDSAGHELAYSDCHDFNPDPVVCFELPRDDVYTLAIKDSLYRGREDFVYRIALGELPFITSVFPLGGTTAGEGSFHCTGWNLPTDTLHVAAAQAGTFDLALRSHGTLSNAVRVALEAEPSVPEVEPNQTATAAQTIKPPVMVDGQIGRAGDVDVFQFVGRAGQPIIAETFARRLGSPLDSHLVLMDATGRVLADNDDHEDKGAGLMTHHADSQVTLTLPTDGTYFVAVTDSQGHGGPAYAYRLRLGPPQPDFELRVVPSAINARPGGNTPFTVYALRRDGFDGEIALALSDAPPGFLLAGARIPAGQDRVTVTLAVPRRGNLLTANALPTEPFSLGLVGTATIDGKPLRRRAVPADDLMQAFAYHHLVPARALLVDVTDQPAMPVARTTRETLRLPRGGSANVPLRTNVPRGVARLTAELNDAPEGLRVTQTRVTPAGAEVTIACDATTTKAAAGNLVVLLFGERAADDKAGAKRNNPRVVLGSSPAVPYEVVTPAK